MALSNEEQRTLDEIERALRDDNPKYVNAVSVDHPGATGRAWRVRVPTTARSRAGPMSRASTDS